MLPEAFFVFFLQTPRVSPLNLTTSPHQQPNNKKSQKTVLMAPTCDTVLEKALDAYLSSESNYGLAEWQFFRTAVVEKLRTFTGTLRC